MKVARMALGETFGDGRVVGYERDGVIVCAADAKGRYRRVTVAELIRDGVGPGYRGTMCSYRIVVNKRRLWGAQNDVRRKLGCANYYDAVEYVVCGEFLCDSHDGSIVASFERRVEGEDDGETE